MDERCVLCGKDFRRLTNHHCFFPKKRMSRNIIVRICQACHAKFNRYVDNVCKRNCTCECGDFQYICGYSGWFGDVPFRGENRKRKRKRRNRKG